MASCYIIAPRLWFVFKSSYSLNAKFFMCGAIEQEQTRYGMEILDLSQQLYTKTWPWQNHHGPAKWKYLQGVHCILGHREISGKVGPEQPWLFKIGPLVSEMIIMAKCSINMFKHAQFIWARPAIAGVLFLFYRRVRRCQNHRNRRTTLKPKYLFTQHFHIF